MIKFLRLLSIAGLTSLFTPEPVEADTLDFSSLECVDAKGLQVDYFEISNNQMRSLGGLFAFATIEQGRPYIVYEQEFLGQMPIPFQEMALAHECAHHNNGDLYNVEVPETNDLNEHFNTVVIPTEDNADRIALEFLVNERGYGQSEITAITETWHYLVEYAKEESPTTVPFIEDKAEKIQKIFDDLNSRDFNLK